MSTLHTFKNAAERRSFTDEDSKKLVTSYIITGIFWLLAGSILAILASFKLHIPEFLGKYPPLTFGRVRPLHLNTMVYGWASLTGTGVGLWILTRTLRVCIPYKKLLYAGLAIWNIALVIACFDILGGNSNGLEWLEIPMPTAGGILFGLVTALLAAMAMLFTRTVENLYISVYYIIAGLLWLPSRLIGA